MKHRAFEKPCNLTGIGAASWLKLAEEAEKSKNYRLAIKYYENVQKTALSVNKSARAAEKIKVLLGRIL